MAKYKKQRGFTRQNEHRRSCMNRDWKAWTECLWTLNDGIQKLRGFTKLIEHRRSCKTRGWTGRKILRRCYWVFLSGAWGEAENREASQNRLSSSIRKNSKGDQILAPNLAGPWERSFDSEEMLLLRSSITGGHMSRTAKEESDSGSKLCRPWKGSFDGEDMPLLRSCLNGGHSCRSAKEIRFKQQTLQGPEKDHLTWRDAVAEVFC